MVTETITIVHIQNITLLLFQRSSSIIVHAVQGVPDLPAAVQQPRQKRTGSGRSTEARGHQPRIEHNVCLIFGP